MSLCNDDCPFENDPTLWESLKAADALAKAAAAWAQRGYDEREDEMHQAVEDALAAYEKVRGK